MDDPTIERGKPDGVTTLRDPPKVGWFKFFNSRKFHWIVKGRSLCGKWLYLGNGELEFSMRASPDDCKTCRRQLDTTQ